eukprot:scaffold199782_cov35-Attheya_sp.AAC.1
MSLRRGEDDRGLGDYGILATTKKFHKEGMQSRTPANKGRIYREHIGYRYIKLIPAVNIRNKSYHKWSSDPTEPNREIYKTKRNELNRLKRQAIGRWMKKIASRSEPKESMGSNQGDTGGITRPPPCKYPRNRVRDPLYTLL